MRPIIIREMDDWSVRTGKGRRQRGKCGSSRLRKGKVAFIRWGWRTMGGYHTPAHKQSAAAAASERIENHVPCVSRCCAGGCGTRYVVKFAYFLSPYAYENGGRSWWWWWVLKLKASTSQLFRAQFSGGEELRMRVPLTHTRRKLVH